MSSSHRRLDQTRFRTYIDETGNDPSTRDHPANIFSALAWSRPVLSFSTYRTLSRSSVYSFAAATTSPMDLSGWVPSDSSPISFSWCGPASPSSCIHFHTPSPFKPAVSKHPSSTDLFFFFFLRNLSLRTPSASVFHLTFQIELANIKVLRDMTDMNYVSAVYGVVILVIFIDWQVRGRRKYRGQEVRHEEGIALANKVAQSESVVR